mgnify:CR=1 FL=1
MMHGIIEGGLAQYVCQRSRFHAFVFPLETIDDVKILRHRIAKEHGGASHFPYAYRFDDQSFQDDDGEPSGTGGAPLFNALKSHNLNRTMIIVARYFGGKKLGVKGLRAAFAQAASIALAASVFGSFSTQMLISLSGPLEQMSVLHRFVLETDARIENITYNKTISATLIFSAFEPDYLARRLPDWNITARSERTIVT